VGACQLKLIIKPTFNLALNVYLQTRYPPGLSPPRPGLSDGELSMLRGFYGLNLQL